MMVAARQTADGIQNDSASIKQRGQRPIGCWPFVCWYKLPLQSGNLYPHFDRNELTKGMFGPY